MLGDTIGLGNHELVSQELVYCHLTLARRFLSEAKLLRENDVITNLLSYWLLNLVALKLKQFIFDNIVLLELVPVFLSFIK